MRIIPVLDLKDGLVVRAAGGRRDDYRPIVTPLSETADIVDVARGLRALHPFRTFYIADLDAIAGQPANESGLARLSRLEDPPEIWLDAGFGDARQLEAALDQPLLSPVLGSESQADEGLLRRFRDSPRLVLSLDFFADGFRGPSSLLDPDLWPRTIIVMTLAQVGSAAGPDLSRLQMVVGKAGDREVVAAGGVRGEADLSALSGLGVAAALVATSLHDGSLGSDALARLGA